MALKHGVRNDESKLTWTPFLVNHHPAFHKPTLRSFFRSSLSCCACGQVLWHKLSNPGPQRNKFSLYSQSFYGNLISSTLTALSSFLPGFFSSCSSSLWMCFPFYFCSLKAHIQNIIPQKKILVFLLLACRRVSLLFKINL